jgi:hypothetical protein
MIRIVAGTTAYPRKKRPKRTPAMPLAIISETKIHPLPPLRQRRPGHGHRRISTTELLKRYHFPAAPTSRLVRLSLRWGGQRSSFLEHPQPFTNFIPQVVAALEYFSARRRMPGLCGLFGFILALLCVGRHPERHAACVALI